MARIRSIKPKFFFDHELAQLGETVQLFFIGLWCHVDSAGRVKDEPHALRAQIYPYQPAVDGEALLAKLHPKFIIRYEVDGVRYLQIRKWKDHQKPHSTEHESYLPPVPKTVSTTLPPPAAKPLKPSKVHEVVPEAQKPPPEAPEAPESQPAAPEPVREPLDPSGEPIKAKKVKDKRDPAGEIVASPAFEEFWKYYPRKAERIQAWRAWQILEKAGRLPAVNVLIKALVRQMDAGVINTRGEVRYIPLPANWLEKEKWDDETGISKFGAGKGKYDNIVQRSK